MKRLRCFINIASSRIAKKELDLQYSSNGGLPSVAATTTSRQSGSDQGGGVEGFRRTYYDKCVGYPGAHLCKQGATLAMAWKG